MVIVTHKQSSGVVSVPEQNSNTWFLYFFNLLLVEINGNKNHLIKLFTTCKQKKTKGDTTTELNVQSSLFISNPQILLWKFEFTLTSTTPANGIATGQSSMIVLVNKLPYGGSCTVSPTSGVALNTSFSIACSNWLDDDGDVAQFAYFG